MRAVILVFFAVALTMTPALGGQVRVHFEDQPAGTSVEGMGAVHPFLEINAVYGTAIVIEGGVLPSVYGAANGTGSANNCLEDADGFRVDFNQPGATPAKGFADPDAKEAGIGQHFEFTFGGRTINSFSIRMFDFGDLNPGGATQHAVMLTGFQQNGVVSTSMSYSSDGEANPHDSPEYGDLYVTGDACSASFGEPGYAAYQISGPAIHKVVLEVSGADPNVGFDSLVFTTEVDIDIKPQSYPNCFNIGDSGTIPVAVLGSDSLDVGLIDPSTLSFAGLDVRVRNSGTVQCSIEDVSGDFTVPQGSPDGYDDLVCHFTDDSTAWSPGTDSACLTGQFLDGTALRGCDEICVNTPQEDTNRPRRGRKKQ